jgi:CheY-like chemotaxis protein
MNRDKQLSASQKEYNLSIIRAGEHLLALINDILELSKVEAGRVVLNPANIDLYSMLDDIQMIFKERARSKKLQFIFEKSNDLPRYIFVDEGKLRQIFVNLIGNALKFTEEGGVAVRTRIDKVKEDVSHLVVEVQDSGPGIAENEMHKLFENFEQTSSGINKGSGTGLGLALSRELAILMGGGITVTSEVGKGSVFTFRVEINEGNSAFVETSSAKSVIGIDQGEEIYRILVVDDKKENLKVAVTLLQLVGFQTKEAVNGEDAIAKFSEWNPNLVLMDMRMPVMDGYEATRRIKATEKGKQTPIVALTASTFEDELKQIDSLGIQGYIRKPFRENELFGIIGKLLGIKYIYDDQAPSLQLKYLNNENALAEDMAKLPNRLVLKMQQALAVADLDLMIELIKTMEQDNPELTQQLMSLAVNYDYDQLQQLLNKKEKIG